MQLRFNIGRKRGGGLGVQKVALYVMPDWRRVRAEANFVEYRPSARTALYHLPFSLMAAATVAAIIWLAGWPWNRAPAIAHLPREGVGAEAGQTDADLQDAMRDIESQLSSAQRAELQLRHAERTAALSAERDRLASRLATLNSVGRAFHWASLAVFSLIATVPLATLTFARVVIERSSAEELVIRRRGFWPTTRRWPADAFGEISFGVEEEIYRRRWRRFSRGNRITLGWRWLVRLTPDRRGWLTDGPGIVDDPEVLFLIDYQREKPADAGQPTVAGAQLIADLRQILNLHRVRPFSAAVELANNRIGEVTESLTRDAGGNRPQSPHQKTT